VNAPVRESGKVALLERVIESQSRRIIQLEDELKLVNPDAYVAKVEGYAAGYHDGYGDGRDAERNGGAR
jgi:hypothetical protein